MNARPRILVPAAVAAVLVGIALYGVAGPSHSAEDDAIGLDAAAPAPTELPTPPDRGFVGVLGAGDAVDVAARADGLLTEVRVRLGDRVTRDSIIATLNDGSLRDELAVTKATLGAEIARRQQGILELAEASERLRRSDDINRAARVPVVSEEEISGLAYKEKHTIQQLKAMDASVAAQQARVRGLERRIGESTLRAPFNGLVARRYVDSGATVHSGDPIVRLVSEGELWVRFVVPKEQGARLARNRRVEVRVDSRYAVLHGVVERVAPEVETTSQMIFAEARLMVPPELREIPLAGRVARVHFDDYPVRPP